jgi:DNA-binding FadR family transcriptional regulator
VTTSARPIRRSEKRAETVAREIVHDVVARGLEPGARLAPEAVMCEDYRIGRATLREALRILEVHGLIAIKPGAGGGPILVGASSRAFGRTATLFFEMRRATFGDLADARTVLEPLMARLAAERQDEVSIARLQRALREEVAIAAEDDRSWAAGSTSFHGVVAGLSGNRILDLFGEAIKEIWFDRILGLAFQPADRAEVHRSHQAVADAIVEGDGALAEGQMRAHMQDAIRLVADGYGMMFDDILEWR